MLVIEGASVFFGIEVAALPAPISPGSCKTMEHLFGRALACRVGCLIGSVPPQPFGNAVFRHSLHGRRNAGFSEIFLRKHVAGDLAPPLRHFNVRLLENHRAVRIADFARCRTEGDTLIWRTAFDREKTLDARARQAPDLALEVVVD